MIQSYQFQLSTSMPANAAYPLYAAMLGQAPKDFATMLHESSFTPISQHVCGDIWRVSLFDSSSINTLSPVLESLNHVFLRREQKHLELRLNTVRTIDSVDELLNSAVPDHGVLSFQTPTAFKSAGSYQLLPTQRLLMQSLLLKWNGYFGDICPIEDDGGGLEALSEGLCYRSIHLDSQEYTMKHIRIPGIVGEIDFDNRLSGFHRQLSNALLTFGSYSGIGIKTALGMGGLQIKMK